MTIKNISNTSAEELVQAAYSTFIEKGTLQINVNRLYSKLKLPKNEHPLVLSKHLRDACLKSTAKKVDDEATYFFHTSDGDICCVDQDIVDRFTTMAKDTMRKEKYSELKFFVSRFAVVDTETDTELMPANIAPSYVQFESDKFPFSIKASALVTDRKLESP